MKFRHTLLILFYSFLIFSCSTTEEIVENTSGGIYPSWYSANGFGSDSTNFSGYGLAIASDSSVAITRATEDAKKHLDLAIGKMAEDVRNQLVANDVASAGNTDFILILRNAHADAIKKAELIAHTVIGEGGNYRAFAKVEISREMLITQLEFGFNGHPRYWAAYSENPNFQSVFN